MALQGDGSRAFDQCGAAQEGHGAVRGVAVEVGNHQGDELAQPEGIGRGFVVALHAATEIVAGQFDQR